MTAILNSNQSEWRKRREQRILDLLPDEEDEIKNVDPNLLLRLTVFLQPYRSRVIWAVVLMII